MNNITKRNNLSWELSHYAAFLKHCETREQSNKLSNQIKTLAGQINDIKAMDRDQLHRQNEVQVFTLPSKLNCMDDHPLTPVEHYGKRTT